MDDSCTECKSYTPSGHPSLLHNSIATSHTRPQVTRQFSPASSTSSAESTPHYGSFNHSTTHTTQSFHTTTTTATAASLKDLHTVHTVCSDVSIVGFDNFCNTNQHCKQNNNKCEFNLIQVNLNETAISSKHGLLHTAQKDLLSLLTLLSSSRLLTLLLSLSLPLALTSSLFPPTHPLFPFISTLTALICLSCLIARFVEQLCHQLSSTTASLVNAAFGNILELVVSVVALKHDMIERVKNVLIGSVLEGCLLGMGCSLLICGFVEQHPHQHNRHALITMGQLLLVAALAWTVPSTYQWIYSLQLSDCIQSTVSLSRIIACILLMVYMVYLYGQMSNHQTECNDVEQEVEVELYKIDSSNRLQQNQFSLAGLIVLLLLLTVAVSLCSDTLVDSIEQVLPSLHVTSAFIEIILFPLVSNTSVQWCSLMLTCQGRIDLSLAVTMGSAAHVALFVLPLTVVIGWMLNTPMTLSLPPLQLMILSLTILISNFTLREKHLHQLTGICLCAAHLICATAFLCQLKTQTSEIGQETIKQC